MIVKILKPSASFNGVDYNENKQDKGKGQLLAAKNFTGLGHLAGGPSREDYIRYLERHASTNTRVKNKQFHATISVEGREKSPEELKRIGEEWLKLMGYGKIPYLIYSHSDTANNHIHLVSSRVDGEGKKVSDRFERIRAQEKLEEVLGIDSGEKFDQALEKLLGYHFTNVNQAIVLAKSLGYHMERGEGGFLFYRNGAKVGTLPEKRILGKTRETPARPERAVQVRALMHKYRGLYGGDLEGFRDHMRKSLGLELHFHYGKGQAKPFGYTLIDHKGKLVLKGSTVMDLSELLSGERPVKRPYLRKVNGLREDFQGQKGKDRQPFGAGASLALELTDMLGALGDDGQDGEGTNRRKRKKKRGT